MLLKRRSEESRSKLSESNLERYFLRKGLLNAIQNRTHAKKTPLQYQIKFYKTANIYQREQEKRKRK